MPVRKVSNRGGNVIGRFPSLKMGRMIAFESLLERDFIYLLDYDIRVECFEEQPLTIEYQYEEQCHHYTPDFHLVVAGRHVLVECKPESFVETDENRRKFVAAHGWCEKCGWEFRVVTDQHVRSGFRLQNIKRLTPYARLTVDPILRGRIGAFLREAPAFPTLQDVVQAIGLDDLHQIMASLLHLAFRHEIDLPLDTAPLSGATVITWPSQASAEVKR